MNRQTIRQWIQSHRRLFQVFRILLVFGLLGALFWAIPVIDVLKILAETNLALLALSLILLIPIFLLMAGQLLILSNAQKLHLSLGRLLVINLTLRFYDLFLPAGGAAVRWYKMSQPTGKKVRVLAVLAFNRLFSLFLTLSMTLGFWILSQSKGLKTGLRNFGIIYGLFLGIIILAWLAFLRFGEPFAQKLESAGRGQGANPVFRWIAIRLGRLINSLKTFRNLSQVDILLLIIVGIGWQLLGVIAFTIKARSVSIETSFLDLGWLRGVVTFATILPISIAGGMGIREVSTVALMVTLGVAPEQALAFSLLVLAQNIFLALLGGLFEAGESLQATRLSRQS